MGEFLGQFFSACSQFQAKCRKILTCKAIETQRKNAIWHFMWNFLSTAFMEQQQQYVVVATLVCGWNAKEKKLQSFRATAAVAAGCTLVSVSRCAKFVQKLYQSKFHSKYLGYPRASQFVFIFSCSTHTRPYLFEAVNCFQKKCARTWTIYRFRRHLSPISSPLCTSGPSRLQPIAFLPPIWPQNWNESENRLWTVQRRTALKIWIEEPGRASCWSFSPQRSVCARVKGH